MPEANFGNVVIGIVGVANVATIVYLVRVVISPVAASVKTLSESVKELYQSRDCHEVDITEIKTIHKLRGCDLPQPHNLGGKK